VPLYSYLCDDCGAALEILHGIGKTQQFCRLDCRLQGAGSFGKGRVSQQLDAANLAIGATSAGQEEASAALAQHGREALRQKGLQKLGGTLSEGDLDRLRDKGVAVYRKDGKQSWAKDGGPSEAPPSIKPDGDES
jgi:hypothetical protein